MAVYLLDSSVIINILNRKRNRAAQLAQLVREGNILACCAINVAEVYAGMRPAEAEKRSDCYEPGLLRADLGGRSHGWTVQISSGPQRQDSLVGRHDDSGSRVGK
jgi:hypothetical protein